MYPFKGCEFFHPITKIMRSEHLKNRVILLLTGMLLLSIFMLNFGISFNKNDVALAVTNEEKLFLQVNHFDEKYAAIPIQEIVSNQQLTEDQKKIAASLESLINKAEFSEIIDVFSQNLFADVPTNDAFQGQKYEITDLEVAYERIKQESSEFSQWIVLNSDLTMDDESVLKKNIILLSYLIRWGDFSNGNDMFWNALYSSQGNYLNDTERSAFKKTLVSLFESNPSQYLASKNVKDTISDALKPSGKNLSYKQAVEEFLSLAEITDYSE
jgi:hypothetical protein